LIGRNSTETGHTYFWTQRIAHSQTLPTPVRITFSIARREEGLVTFVMFPCALQEFVQSQ